MTNDNRAHRVCEEYLTILRRSQLNYLVNETPYSAHISIRKKFLKDARDLSNVTFAIGGNNENLNIENCFLNQRCKDLEDRIRYLEEDTEGSDLKVKKLTSEL